MKKLSIEAMYELYLHKVGLLESEMHPTQRIETKRAFYAGCGQTLIATRDEIGAMEDEREAMRAFESLTEEVMEFWNNEGTEENE